MDHGVGRSVDDIWRSRGDFTPRRHACGPAARQGENGAVATVLVVEDEREIRDLLRRYLERAGHAVLSAGTGSDGLRLLHEGDVDLVLLDLGLPDVDGLEILDTTAALQVPAIALTARSSVDDRIAGLRHGADDYVVKPFSPQEVVLRVGAVLNRTVRQPSSTDTFGDGRLRIDHERHEVSLDGKALDVTPSEWGVLDALVSRPGRVYSRAELLNRVRGFEFSGYERTIDSHVKNLRRKLGDEDASMIQTVVGVGYRMGLDRD